jgi:hypothetical protein
MSRLHRARRLMQKELAEHVGMAEPEAAPAETVSLADYRRRKGGAEA